jgi:flavodoxin
VNEPLRILVVYYSFEGNTKLIAESVAGAVSADIMQLIPKKEHASKGFSKYFGVAAR